MEKHQSKCHRKDNRFLKNNSISCKNYREINMILVNTVLSSK